MAKKRILVVEDDSVNRYNLNRVLDFLGYLSVSVGDGEMAWNILNDSGSFDLVISDNQMPNVSGVELLRRVRTSSPPLSSTPFAIMSGGIYVSRDDHTLLSEVCSDLGATFFEKPVDLFSMVTKLLK